MGDWIEMLLSSLFLLSSSISLPCRQYNFCRRFVIIKRFAQELDMKQAIISLV